MQPTMKIISVAALAAVALPPAPRPAAAVTLRGGHLRIQEKREARQAKEVPEASVGSLLGGGGFGAVHDLRHDGACSANGRKKSLAVKLFDSLVGDDDARREKLVMRALKSSPSIVQLGPEVRLREEKVRSVVQSIPSKRAISSKTRSIVLHKLHGKDLMYHLLERPEIDGYQMPIGAVAKILYDVLQGLVAMDEKKLVHGDLELQNVMLAESPTQTTPPSQLRARIIDLGGARLQYKSEGGEQVLCSEADSKLPSALHKLLAAHTRTEEKAGGLCGGKVGWLSPERCRNTNRVIKLGHKDDVFSLGLVAWALFSGGWAIFHPDNGAERHNAIGETLRWANLRGKEEGARPATLPEQFEAMRQSVEQFEVPTYEWRGQISQIYEHCANAAKDLPWWAQGLVMDALDAQPRRKTAKELLAKYGGGLQEAFGNGDPVWDSNGSSAGILESTCSQREFASEEPPTSCPRGGWEGA